MGRHLKHFSGGGIVGREQRQRTQIAEEVSEPEAADGNGTTTSARVTLKVFEKFGSMIQNRSR